MSWTKSFPFSKSSGMILQASTPLTIGQFLKRAPRTAGSVLSLFLLGNLFILQAVFDDRSGPISVVEIPSSRGGAEFFTTLHKYFVRTNNEWRVAPVTERGSVYTSNHLELNDSLLNCSSLSSLDSFQFVATGWTKSAYRAVLKNSGRSVAVKTVNPRGHDVTECLKQFDNKDAEDVLPECYMFASAKILKEIYLLSRLNHPNVIKMVGYCVPHKRFSEKQTTVAIITELGEPFDVIRLLQMSWEDRLKLTLDLSRLIEFFSSRELGPLRISDFRRQQFVLVNGHLKISDVDDVTFGDIPCQTDKNCVLRLPVSNKSSDSDSGLVSVTCDSGRCRGLSEKSNAIQAGRHFVNFIIPHGVPKGLETKAEQISEAFARGLNSTTLLRRTEDLVKEFARGDYLKESATKRTNSAIIHYKRMADSDLPNIFDYQCRQSLSGQKGCTRSCVNPDEAALYCSSDPQCKAFVFTNETTWTGRRIVSFKSSFLSPVRREGTILYAKID